jgi:hypothetical protein
MDLRAAQVLTKVQVLLRRSRAAGAGQDSTKDIDVVCRNGNDKEPFSFRRELGFELVGPERHARLRQQLAVKGMRIWTCYGRTLTTSGE